jgi:BASS family bile acid:Na+ symporter
MTLDTLIRLGLLLSVWLMVLSLGARASAEDAVFLLRRPVKLALALTAMFVVAPAFAVLLAATTSVPPAIKFAIVAMSVGPVPPILAYKQMKAGGDEGYSVGLMVAASLASIVLTPLLVALAAGLLGAQASIPAVAVVRILLLTIGLPLAAGMILGAFAPKAAAGAVARIAQYAGTLVLLIIFAVMVAAAWREILGLFGNGAALAVVAMVAAGLLIGRVLGGVQHGAALALATASRHPGVALAIAQISYPEQRRSTTAAILLYLLITALVTAPYVRWARGRAAPVTGPGGDGLRRTP